MTRKKNSFEQIRRDLYKTQRTMGDLQAARRGPGPLAKRLIKRRINRRLLRWIWK